MQKNYWLCVKMFIGQKDTICHKKCTQKRLQAVVPLDGLDTAINLNAGVHSEEAPEKAWNKETTKRREQRWYRAT